MNGRKGGSFGPAPLARTKSGEELRIQSPESRARQVRTQWSGDGASVVQCVGAMEGKSKVKSRRSKVEEQEIATEDTESTEEEGSRCQ